MEGRVRRGCRLGCRAGRQTESMFKVIEGSAFGIFN